MSEEASHAQLPTFPPLLDGKTNFLKSIENDPQVLKDKVGFVHEASVSVDRLDRLFTREHVETLGNKERQWLDSLAVECFRMSAIAGERDNPYRLGKLAFAYGIVESVTAHLQKRDITVPTNRASLMQLDETFTKALDITIPAIREFLGLNAISARGVLQHLHEIRTRMATQHPGELPLKSFYQKYKTDMMVIPLYTFAKIHAYAMTNQDVMRLGVGHIELEPRDNLLMTEMEYTVFNLIHGEAPPADTTLDDLRQRRSWSRMAVLGKDWFLLEANTLSPAFVFGNYVIGEMTGSLDYGSRMLASAKTDTTIFFNEMPIELEYYIDESVPKSVWGSLDKVFRVNGTAEKPSINDMMLHLYQQYFKQAYPRKDQLTHPYYYISMRERINMFSEFVRIYFADPLNPENAPIGAFLMRVQAAMKQDVYDIHRVRSYIAEFPLNGTKIPQWDFSRETEGVNFDRICQRVLEEDPNAFVIYDGRVDGKGEFHRILLIDAVKKGSVYQQLADWYEKHKNNDKTERVFASVVMTKEFSDTRCPGELQLIPLKYALFAWQSRTNFKLYSEGEDPYRSYQQK